jgi:hypothetical protein
MAYFGGLCIAVGGALMVIDIVQSLFMKLDLAQRAPVGMGLLLVTVGLIARKVSRL